MSSATPRRVGRPRAQGPSATGSPREDVLAAAAELFTDRGYAATSTRAVAEKAGMRQASLYHWFDGKQSILAALLEGTVRPSLALARGLLEDTSAPPAARLRALCRADVALLCGGPHNLGVLYLLPEVQAERFADFHHMRTELKSAYGRLLAQAAPELPEDQAALRTDLVFGLIEGVILIRRQDPSRSAVALAALAEAAADGALRVAGIVPAADG